MSDSPLESRVRNVELQLATMQSHIVSEDRTNARQFEECNRAIEELKRMVPEAITKAETRLVSHIDQMRVAILEYDDKLSRHAERDEVTARALELGIRGIDSSLQKIETKMAVQKAVMAPWVKIVGWIVAGLFGLGFAVIQTMLLQRLTK